MHKRDAGSGLSEGERSHLRQYDRETRAVTGLTELPYDVIDKARRVLEKHDALDLADMLFCPTNS